jgi:predicted ArsR family transcriptional regulator
LATTTKRGQKRTIEEAVAYAVGHRIRIDALAILNEGRASPNEIAKILGVGVSLVGHHIKELHDSGCIEAAGTEQVRGATEHFYRAIEQPFISDEEARELPPEAKREFSALILQAIAAEGLASLRAGKMDSDDDIRMCWRSMNLDAEGRREVAEEQAESLGRLVDIETRAATRLAGSGQAGVQRIAVMMGFDRSRPGRPPGGYLPPSDG